MEVFGLFIDLYNNIKGFFFNEDGVLDKTRVFFGSAMVLFLIGIIGYFSYSYFAT
ncbi:MAG: hypothetical protein LPK00_06095 [Bacillaceae bacterium]|nr:hypothetical protein [Bacillaceae bacterium]